MLENLIIHLNEQGLLAPIDMQFAALMQRLSGQADPRLFLAAALVSQKRRAGDVCLNLAEPGLRELIQENIPDETPALPESKEWAQVLRDSAVVGEPGESKPLILDQKYRLYLFRYWEYQSRLSEGIQKHLKEIEPLSVPETLKPQLDRYFVPSNPEEIDWQKAAAFTCLRGRFAMISGGPGTGKTYTVVKILALLLEQSGEKPLRIALTAPTGKGAARLQETIGKIKPNLPCPDAIKNLIPNEAQTIHRLLKSIPGSPYFRFNEQNPLPLDLLVLDEASMTDLALMSKLVQALAPACRLIILGDKDQLASVEAGAVFGDLCDTGTFHAYSADFCLALESATGFRLDQAQSSASGSGLQDCLVQLQRSYRFSAESGIARLSRAVNEGDVDQVISLLKGSSEAEEVVWRNIPDPEKMPRLIEARILDRFKECFRATEFQEFFALFEKFRILCGLREGPYGVKALNRTIEKLLSQNSLIRNEGKWYQGKPVLITRNDYNLGLFNGDSGVAWPDSKAGRDLRVYFPETKETVKKFHPLRLPEHENLYAMTVHKSQGSEFDDVLLILPDRDAPVLTRELIYTAITRARRRVEIWGREEVLRTTINRRTRRTSGLRDELWK